MKRLEALKLTKINRRQGRPRTTKKLERYKLAPKPFKEKSIKNRNKSKSRHEKKIEKG